MSQQSTVADSHSGTDSHGGEHDAGHHPPQSPPLDELFDNSEIAEFDADDVTAGRHIGKLLAFFFLYTVIAMGVAALWTYWALTE